MKMLRNNQQGITWIEIVIIVFILGILAMIAIPRFIDFQTQTQVQTPAEATQSPAP